MNPEALFAKLFEYDYWGNCEVLASLGTVAASAERPQQLFNHIIGAQRIWLARFTNPNPADVQPWPAITQEDCRAAVDELHGRWRAILGGMTPEQWTGNLTYLNTKGVEFTTPIQDVLMHLLLHSAYHRGQVAAAVREAGGKSAATDYIVYVRKNPQ